MPLSLKITLFLKIHIKHQTKENLLISLDKETNLDELSQTLKKTILEKSKSEGRRGQSPLAWRQAKVSNIKGHSKHK